MKHLLKFTSGMLMCAFVATMLSMFTGVDVGNAFAGCVAVSTVLSFMPMPSGMANAVVLKQLWETALITAFRSQGNWPGRIPRKDNYVNNNAINLTEIGADPTLLINNTSYPIATAVRTDNNNVLALNKYDTTNTKILRDELYALPYDKEGSVIEQHKLVIIEGTRKHGLWNLAIAGDTATTPLVETTGADNGAGRKRLKTADILALKLRLDNLNVPKEGRCLVMCSTHINDILLEDQSFNLRYQNHKVGEMVAMYLGFEIFEDNYNPVYSAANAKIAFGVAAAGTDRNASVFFIAQRSFQASGTTEMFYRDKSMDPENRMTVVGFEQYHIAGPMKNTGFGVIVSDDLL